MNTLRYHRIHKITSFKSHLPQLLVIVIQFETFEIHNEVQRDARVQVPGVRRQAGRAAWGGDEVHRPFLSQVSLCPFAVAAAILFPNCASLDSRLRRTFLPSMICVFFGWAYAGWAAQVWVCAWRWTPFWATTLSVCGQCAFRWPRRGAYEQIYNIRCVRVWRRTSLPGFLGISCIALHIYGINITHMTVHYFQL